MARRWRFEGPVWSCTTGKSRGGPHGPPRSSESYVLQAAVLLLAGGRVRDRLAGVVRVDERALELQLAAGAALEPDVGQALGGAPDRGREVQQRRRDAGERLDQVRRDRHVELVAVVAGRPL